MSLDPLTLENLKDFDGGSLANLVDMGIQQVSVDLLNRPELDKVRKVTIQLEFKPVADGKELDHVVTTAQVKVTVPNRETRVNTLIPARRGGLEFNASHPIARPSDRDQSELPFGKDE